MSERPSLTLFAHVCARPEAELDLAEAALLIAEADAPGLDVAHYVHALDALGEEKRLHRPIYDVINFDGVILSDEDKLVAWVAHNGIDRDKFLAVYNSDEVKAKVEAARKATIDYGVKATPTLVVGGKYLFSSGLAGSHYEAIRLLNQTVEQMRREKR